MTAPPLTTTPSAATAPVTPPQAATAKRRAARQRAKRAALVLAAAAVVAAAVCAARAGGWFQPAELKAYDALVRSGPRPTPWSDRVTVVGIDEADLNQPGYDYPIPDGKMAELLRAILAYGPKAVGVDVFRDRVVFHRDGDKAVNRRAELEQVWADHDNVVFVFEVGKRRPGEAAVKVRPPPGAPSTATGFADYPVDDDGIVRRGQFLIPTNNIPTNNKAPATQVAAQPATQEAPAGGGGFHWSMPLQLMAASLFPAGLRPEPRLDHTGVEFGPHVAPYLRAAEGAYVGLEPATTPYLLDYRSALDGLADGTVTARDVLAGKVPAERFRDRVVLVGMTADSVKDFIETPVGTRYGVTVHAVAVNQLLAAAADGTVPPRTLSRAAEGWLTAALALLGAAAGLLVWRPVLMMLAGVAALAGIMAGAWWAFRGGWWLPTVPPAVAWAAAASVVASVVARAERAGRRQVDELFVRYVSADVAETILANQGQLMSGGKIRPRRLACATALFTDLEGFSAVAEQVEPDALLDWLNEWTDELSECVKENGGFVNKFMGDSLMAMFGAPLPREGEAEFRADAAAAVRCALAMRAAFAALQARWRDRGLPTVRMRIGVYSGECVTGSIGGAGRLEYTVTGDAVNTAARLEQYDKSMMDPDITAGDCRVLIGQPTLDLVPGLFQTRFVAEERMRKMGKTVAIHGVIGPA
jgi:adenylate cyclase